MLTKSQAKYIQSLSQKKFRDEEHAFVAEGPKIINELLAARNVELMQLFALENWDNENSSEKKIIVTERELERLSFLQTPNQVLAVFKKPFFGKPSFENKITLLLDGIQDPGNMGTIIRTADWFCVENIICSPESADVFNPKTVQSTMGSISRVQVVQEDLKLFVNNHSNIPLYATALNGRNLFDIKSIKEGFILIGNESKGIHEDLFLLSKEKITIPKSGEAESLNAAVAAGIMLAWANKQ
jgi:TrmH family RNA methyltransferase